MLGFFLTIGKQFMISSWDQYMQDNRVAGTTGFHYVQEGKKVNFF